MEIVLLTVILGATILLAVYISQIFKSKAASPVEEEGSKEAEEEEVTSKETSTGKTKKKVVDKRQKESFQPLGSHQRRLQLFLLGRLEQGGDRVEGRDLEGVQHRHRVHQGSGCLSGHQWQL